MSDRDTSNIKVTNLPPGKDLTSGNFPESSQLAKARVRSDRKSKPTSRDLIQNPAKHFAELFSIGKTYVEMARALLSGDPTAAASVKKGGAGPKGRPGENSSIDLFTQDQAAQALNVSVPSSTWCASSSISYR
jgi:hypothetical protein